MSRLIDADKLAERIRRAALPDDLTTTMARELAERWIEDAPTIEAQHTPSAWAGRLTAMEHLPPDRSEKFRCDRCGNVCYYPQPTRGDRTLKMPYRYCPHCGCRIMLISEAGWNETDH